MDGWVDLSVCKVIRKRFRTKRCLYIRSPAVTAYIIHFQHHIAYYPLTIEVYPRRATECELTDDGFSPSLLRLDEGSTVRWHWSGTSVGHTITEVRYSHKTGRFARKETDMKQLPSKASDCVREFPWVPSSRSHCCLLLGPPLILCWILHVPYWWCLDWHCVPTGSLECTISRRRVFIQGRWTPAWFMYEKDKGKKTCVCQ